MGGRPSRSSNIDDAPRPSRPDRSLPPPHQSSRQPPEEPEPAREEPKKTAEEEPEGSPPPSERDFYEEALARAVNLKLRDAFITESYGTDGETGLKCCMQYARCLSITWGDDPRYWQWFPLQERSNARVEVAALLNVCWLEIRGSVDVTFASREATYEAAFVVMMNHTSYGWHAPVNLTLVDPEGNMQKRVENLADKPRGEWVELVAGEFRTATAASSGRVEVSLFECEDGGWKNGLVVKGVRIRPVKGSNPKRQTAQDPSPLRVRFI